MISDLFDLCQLDDLVARTHSEDINELAAAALIEHEGRFLLIDKPSHNFELTPPTWELPTGGGQPEYGRSVPKRYTLGERVR